MLSAMSSLIRGLSTKIKLSDTDRQALETLPIDISDVKRGQDVVREGERSGRCLLVVSGMVCSHKLLANGRRQILALHIQGDLPNLQSLLVDVQDCSILTLSDCQLGFVQHHHIRDLCMKSPTVAMVLWRSSLLDASIFKEWTANVGQRQSTARMAHLFCETLTRLNAMGLAPDHSADFPLTQADLGDALGISTVHVNRTVMELRKTGSVSLERGRLSALNWPLLQRQGQFDPSYLNLHAANSKTETEASLA